MNKVQNFFPLNETQGIRQSATKKFLFELSQSIRRISP